MCILLLKVPPSTQLHLHKVEEHETSNDDDVDYVAVDSGLVSLWQTEGRKCFAQNTVYLVALVYTAVLSEVLITQTFC